MRTISRLAGVVLILIATLHLILGGSTPADTVLSWTALAYVALVVLVWTGVHKFGTDSQRQEFPIGRALIRQMRDDLRPVKLWLGHTWQNIGGW
jgi:hypothetical protein